MSYDEILEESSECAEALVSRAEYIRRATCV